MTLTEEHAVEVPQVFTLESVQEVTQPEWRSVPREVSRVEFEAVEKIVEKSVPTCAERPVEVPETYPVECISEELAPVVQQVAKHVPRVETQLVDRTVAVPQVLLSEVAVEVPFVQRTEQIRQEAMINAHQVEKEIPKVVPFYVEKNVEVKMAPFFANSEDRTMAVGTYSQGRNLGSMRPLTSTRSVPSLPRVSPSAVFPPSTNRPPPTLGQSRSYGRLPVEPVAATRSFPGVPRQHVQPQRFYSRP